MDVNTNDYDRPWSYFTVEFESTFICRWGFDTSTCTLK